MTTALKILARFSCLLALSAFVVSGSSVLADPPGNKGKGKKPEHAKSHKPKKHHGAVHHTGGPPPWAPAHGYRRNKGQGSDYYASGSYAYTVPYGIDGGHCNRKELGIVLGGLGGGLIGSQVASKDDKAVGIIAGAIIGAVVGGSIGNSMDKADHNCVGQALEHAPDGQRITWQNPDAGVNYNVTPVRTYQESETRYCREYQTVSEIDGRRRETYGTACRREDGAWHLVN